LALPPTPNVSFPNGGTMHRIATLPPSAPSVLVYSTHRYATYRSNAHPFFLLSFFLSFFLFFFFLFFFYVRAPSQNTAVQKREKKREKD
jgi:predicted PurR-regulated permease PerM